MVIDAEGTVLYQVLYSSPHNNEVFFFFKGYPQSGGDDLENDGPGKSTKTQVAFINLTPSEEELEMVGEFRAVDKHCHGFVTLKEHGILDTFITTLNTTEYHEQEMLPSPTCIDTVLFNPLVTEPGKTIVFTAFLHEDYISKEWMELLENGRADYNGVAECWYPNIFFYDLEQNMTIWEIFGAEQFIRMKNKRVNYLTNDMWRMISKEEYDMRVM